MCSYSFPFENFKNRVIRLLITIASTEIGIYSVDLALGR